MEKLAQLTFNCIEAEVPNENVFQDAHLPANRGAANTRIGMHQGRQLPAHKHVFVGSSVDVFSAAYTQGIAYPSLR